MWNKIYFDQIWLHDKLVFPDGQLWDIFLGVIYLVFIIEVTERRFEKKKNFVYGFMTI